MLLARVLALWAAFGSHCHRKPSLAGDRFGPKTGVQALVAVLLTAPRCFGFLFRLRAGLQ